MLLSFGGHLILVNDVLSTLPLYFMSIFKLSSWVLKKIDCICCSFLWSALDSAIGIACKMNWGKVYLSKDEGVPGVKDLKALNLAMLFEQCNV